MYVKFINKPNCHFEILTTIKTYKKCLVHRLNDIVIKKYILETSIITKLTLCITI